MRGWMEAAESAVKEFEKRPWRLHHGDDEL
jgi:hypothetical protein